MIERGDLVCYKGDRSALATVAMVNSLDYGTGRVLRKAKIVWLTGPNVGRNKVYDVRDLVKVEK